MLLRIISEINLSSIAGNRLDILMCERKSVEEGTFTVILNWCDYTNDEKSALILYWRFIYPWDPKRTKKWVNRENSDDIIQVNTENSDDIIRTQRSSDDIIRTQRSSDDIIRTERHSDDIIQVNRDTVTISFEDRDTGTISSEKAVMISFEHRDTVMISFKWTEKTVTSIIHDENFCFHRYSCKANPNRAKNSMIITGFPIVWKTEEICSPPLRSQ